MANIKSIEEKLKENGYKLTHQRKAMIKVLLESKNHFLSAEEIYFKTKEMHPSTNFSTIYRNLEILENIKIVHKITMHQISSYSIICQDTHHHHMICKGCGKKELIDFCPFDEIFHKVREKKFMLTDHKFEIYGYCEKCQEKNSCGP